MKDNVYVVVLHFGYVESACISFTVYTTEEEGLNKAQAVRSLANTLYLAYKDENGTPSQNACCERARKKAKKSRFCADCGSDLRIKGLDPEKFWGWIEYAHQNDVDTYCGEGLRDITETPWTPWTGFMELLRAKPSQVVEIVENAEKILAMAVDPSIMTDEDREAFEQFAQNPYSSFHFGDRYEVGFLLELKNK